MVSQHCSVEHIQESINDSYKHFDGVIAVYHGEQGSLVHKYLESVKGEGKVILAPWYPHHAFQLNHAFYWGPIQHGDFFVFHIPNEKLHKPFLENYRNLFALLLTHQFDTLYYFGKLLGALYRDGSHFRGNPHIAYVGGTKIAELSEAMHLIPTDNPDNLMHGHASYGLHIFENLRPKRRTDPYHFVKHYAEYYIECPETEDYNHVLLGLDTFCSSQEEVQEVFSRREKIRRLFRQYCRSKDVELNADGAINLFKCEPMEPAVRYFINNEKILNDLYWREVKGGHVTHSHDPKDMTMVE